MGGKTPKPPFLGKKTFKIFFGQKKTKFYQKRELFFPPPPSPKKKSGTKFFKKSFFWNFGGRGIWDRKRIQPSCVYFFFSKRWGFNSPKPNPFLLFWGNWVGSKKKQFWKGFFYFYVEYLNK